MTPREYAGACLANGWVAIPRKGKRPLVSDWTSLSADDVDIESMPWHRADGAFLVIARGAMALDVDDLELFARSGHDVPEAPGQSTPSGGLHRLLRGDAPQVGLKATAGYDTRAGGRGGVAVYDLSMVPPPVDELPPMPSWMGAAPRSSFAQEYEEVDEVTENRNDFLTRYYGALIRAGATRREAMRAVLQANQDRCVPPLPDDELRRTVFAPKSWKRGELPPPPPHPKTRSEAHGGDSGVDLVLTRAADIELKPVRWLWQDRVPVGELTLLAGREGVGKSTFEESFIADITHGKLPGFMHGTPRDVLVVSTEDDWSTTIRPRLMAHGADLNRVYRLTLAERRTGRGIQLHLPEHFGALELAMDKVEPVLVVFSPLISRLTGKLDSHKDQEVRQALEPLVEVVHRRGAAILGLIHMNKSVGADPMKAIMGSVAFGAVARAVLFIQRDPEDPSVRLLGQPKNNLGKTDHDLGLEAFHIEPVVVGRVGREDIVATRIVWDGHRDGSSESVMGDAMTSAETRTATSDAVEFLRQYLVACGGTAAKADIDKAAREAGHERNALNRARLKLGITSDRTKTVPSTTTWTLSEAIPKPKVTIRNASRLTSRPYYTSETTETSETTSDLSDLTHIKRAKRETTGASRTNRKRAKETR